MFVKLLLSPLAVVAVVTLSFSGALADEILIEDQGVAISAPELEAIIATMPAKVRSKVADDVGERLELINGMLIARKLAALADQIGPLDEGYWDLQSAVIAAKYDFMFKQLQSSVVEPDFESLARELYRVNKDKYALVPEVRASSHILFRSPPGIDRTSVKAKAGQVLADLRAGAKFEEMVANHSDDPGSKKRGGSLNRFIKYGDPGITPPYSEALFEIDDVGAYSELVDSQFGVHIIRLDAVQPSTYAEFEKVKGFIIEEVRREFTTLSNKELQTRFNATDELRIDGPKMDELFAPYMSDHDQ